MKIITKMKTRRTMRQLNQGRQQMLNGLKSNIIHEEVVKVAIDLHTHLSILAEKYEEEAVAELLPDVVSLLSEYDACLKVNSDLVNNIQNLTEDMKYLEKQLLDEKERRKHDLETSINNEGHMEDEISKLKLEIVKFKQIESSLVDRLRNENTSNASTQTTKESLLGAKYSRSILTENITPDLLNIKCTLCPDIKAENVLLHKRTSLLEEESKGLQIKLRGMELKLKDAYDEIALVQEGKSIYDVETITTSSSIVTQNRFSPLLNLPEDENISYIDTSVYNNRPSALNVRDRLSSKTFGKGKEPKRQAVKCKADWYMMSDTEIHSGFKAIKSVPSNILIMPPAVSHLLKMQGPKSFKETCSALRLGDYEYVVCAVNDRLVETTEGGNHWSLLVSENRDNSIKFYHWDSAGATNTPEARRLAAKLSDVLTDGGCGGEGMHMVNVPCRQQSGGVECGAYTVHNAEIVCSLVFNNLPLCDAEIFKQSFSVDGVYSMVKEQNVSQTCTKFVNNNNLENKSKTNVENERGEVLLIGDSHVRGMAVKLREIMNEDCEITANCYPGATMCFVLDRLEEQIQRRPLAAKDHIVLVGGTNDTSAAHYARVLDRLPRIIASTEATFVLTELPYLLNLPKHRLDQISICNRRLLSLSLELNVPFLLFSHVLSEKTYFVRSGSHLAPKGKMYVCKKLVTWLRYIMSMNVFLEKNVNM